MRVSACRSDVLSVEVVTLAFAHAVRERDVVGWIYRDGLRCRTAATVCICTRDDVGVRIVDGYRRIAGKVAPRIRIRACRGESDVTALAEAIVAADVDIRQRINRHRDISQGGAAFGISGCDSQIVVLPVMAVGGNAFSVTTSVSTLSHPLTVCNVCV